MRPTDSDDLAKVPAKPNGVHENGGTRKRGAGKSAPGTATDPQKLAGFAGVPPPAVNAPMWPVHAVVWLQPDLTAAAPHSSGLRIERRHRVPVPDFVHPVVTPAAGQRLLAQEGDPLPPNLPQAMPQCDLSPLGWDPRTACAVVGREALK
jgi:hypothetical protein